MDSIANQLLTFFLGPSTRYIASGSAFLFSLNNVLGLQPFKIVVKETNETFAAFNDPTKGPIFGSKDLWITFDTFGIPRVSESFIGNAYSLPEGYDQDNEVDGFGLFAETTSFTWDDLEVFYYNGEISRNIFTFLRNGKENLLINKGKDGNNQSKLGSETLIMHHSFEAPAPVDTSFLLNLGSQVFECTNLRGFVIQCGRLALVWRGFHWHAGH